MMLVLPSITLLKLKMLSTVEYALMNNIESPTINIQFVQSATPRVTESTERLYYSVQYEYTETASEKSFNTTDTNSALSDVLQLIDLIKPRLVVAEAPSTRRDRFEPQLHIAHKLRAKHYTVDVLDQVPTHLCGDYQARLRWILVARRHNTGILDLTAICNSPAPQLIQVLDPVHKIPSSLWLPNLNWNSIFKDGYLIETPTTFSEFPRSPSTRCTYYEFGLLTDLIYRLYQQARKTSIHWLGTNISGQPYSNMNEPIDAKVFSVIYNILARDTKHHPRGTPTNIRIIATEDNSNDTARPECFTASEAIIFSGGSYSGGLVSISSKSINTIINTFGETYTVRSKPDLTVTHQNHYGFRWVVTAIHCKPSSKSCITATVRYVNQVLLESYSFNSHSILLFYYDKTFALFDCHIRGSRLLGYTAESTRRSVYSIYAPSPSLRPLNDIIIYDDRPKTGPSLRYLTLNECLRICQFANDEVVYLRSLPRSDAVHMISCATPIGTLTRLYQLLGKETPRQRHADIHPELRSAPAYHTNFVTTIEPESDDNRYLLFYAQTIMTEVSKRTLNLNLPTSSSDSVHALPIETDDFEYNSSMDIASRPDLSMPIPLNIKTAKSRHTSKIKASDLPPLHERGTVAFAQATKLQV
mmetsp:Transcript_11505/g.14115  ORF Transcript_11505/g.14115 Transcript_11505/m.14115 type:complete len:643 (+) Transcript_11505:252-2180(+)